LDNFCKEGNIKISPATGKCVRSINFCPGKTLCVLGKQDTITMAVKLKKFEGLELPDKLKIGIF